MRIVLLTSDNLRHKAIANSLAKKLELQLVITERKSPAITDTSSFSKEDAEFIKQHFQQRKNTEEKFFGQFKNFPGKAKIIKVAHGQINSWPVLTEIEKTQPDYIILFGTSIIKEQLLSRYPGRIINLHLGLSPYYRGSATNLFPFYYGEPECIGGTIHLATAEVDKGEILYQFRPDMTKEDNLHDIGNKVILKDMVEERFNLYRNQN
jgi:methionyl-tRNA formyltransferase